VNHDELLSRYLDGELTPEERKQVENDPALQKLLRLQELSDLPMTRADFTAEDVLVRAGRSKPRWNWAAAAAAVLLLAVSHAAAFLWGVERAEQPVAINAIGETEELLREAAALDAAAPYDQLEERLVDLRSDLEGHLPALASADVPRAGRLAEHVGRFIIAFDQIEDAGFRAAAARQIANEALGVQVGFTMIPATAHSYERVTPLGEGRFRVLVVHGNRVLRDEGTVAELKQRNEGLTFLITGDDR
jgi:hypothetical protein